ncbi:hypothetical protein AB0C18_09765 [Nonomuraea muscovyensis]|uniref:hypothetical protein n=1 Tax=Nonomuraea muscovyensis TaxID=1124761 RepID=UPI0033EEBF90
MGRAETRSQPGPSIAHDLPKIYFHDLHHTGNTLAASAGASIRELMTRMGHSITRAALIYQHSTDGRQREVARKLDQLARGALIKDPSGTALKTAPTQAECPGR